MTATTDTGDLKPGIFTAADTDATVVILMGLTKIADIALAFKAAGKADLPVAVIQNATLPEQQEVFGTIADIAEKVQESGIGSPAVIVIGEVVRQRINVEAVEELRLLKG